MFGEKRYNTVDYFLKNEFGKKVVKLSLDGGFTCPNRDGTVGNRGCIFCSEQGSGEFAGSRCVSISEQIQSQIEMLKGKWSDAKYLAYFQNFTNTYSDAETLRKIYDEALSSGSISGLCIATRPDCLSEEVLDLLAEYSEKTFLWVELGLQTVNDDSAKFIRRGYSLDVFDSAVEELRKRGIRTVAHLILNLPGETRDDAFRSLDHVIGCGVWGVKLHMLHVLKDTDLCDYYMQTPFHFMSIDEYVNLIVDMISAMPPDMVVHRITGDGSRDSLVAPLWTLNKKYIIGNVEKRLKERGLYQGARFNH